MTDNVIRLPIPFSVPAADSGRLTALEVPDGILVLHQHPDPEKCPAETGIFPTWPDAYVAMHRELARIAVMFAEAGR
jgi:hypothetical protein